MLLLRKHRPGTGSRESASESVERVDLSLGIGVASLGHVRHVIGHRCAFAGDALQPSDLGRAPFFCIGVRCSASIEVG
jgi:hypothetical protein